MWGNHYNFCPTDKSCKKANNEGCGYCPKNTFDPPGFLGGYFSGVGGEWTDDKKSCLTAQDVDGTYACGSDPNGKYYCNANGDGKCMDSCDSCSEFQYDEMTGEAKENVFKHIDGKNMCRNIHCAEIKSQVTGEGYKYCDTTNTCVEECAHGCVNHTHTRGDNCIVPQIPCCYNRNATNYLHILPEYQEHTHPWDECNVVKNSICTYLPGPSEADEDFSWDASKCHANGTKFGKFNFNDGSDGTAEMGLPNRLGEGDEGDNGAVEQQCAEDEAGEAIRRSRASYFREET